LWFRAPEYDEEGMKCPGIVPLARPTQAVLIWRSSRVPATLRLNTGSRLLRKTEDHATEIGAINDVFDVAFTAADAAPLMLWLLFKVRMGFGNCQGEEKPSDPY
jgi:hypothetical protein